MYYKNITFFIFLALIAALFIAAFSHNPTTNLLLMLLIGFLVVYQTFVILKGPKIKEKPSDDQWYENY